MKSIKPDRHFIDFILNKARFYCILRSQEFCFIRILKSKNRRTHFILRTENIVANNLSSFKGLAIIWRVPQNNF